MKSQTPRISENGPRKGISYGEGGSAVQNRVQSTTVWEGVLGRG